MAGVPVGGVRAVQSRVAAVEADTRYDSLIVDGRGVLRAARVNSGGAQTVLVAGVPAGRGNAPYPRPGD